MKIAYLDCFSGISGDMTVGAFLDAGLDPKALSRQLSKLKVGDYKISVHKVKRGEIAGTKFDVIVKDGSHAHRSLKTILALIDKSPLSQRVKATAKDIFTTIGKAEAKVHGVTNNRDIDFHEIGHTDSIVDIVGTAIAIDELGIDEIYCSPIMLGRTFVRTHHGNLPMPGPASLEVLKGVPVSMSDIEAELVTPTGAGIVRAVSKGFGRMPQMAISSIGYGAGTRDLEEAPNMLRVVIGEGELSFKEDKITVIETNIDDMNPQAFQYLFERLLEAGALDVCASAIQMKKSRPGFKLTVLTDSALVKKLSSIIFAETSTIGIRYYEAQRLKLTRKIVRARTKYGNIEVKISTGPSGILTISPEYDDCARIARRNKAPFKTIYEEAKKAASL